MQILEKLKITGMTKEERFKRQEEAEKKHVAFIQHKKKVLTYLSKRIQSATEWYVLFFTEPNRKGEHQLFRNLSQEMFQSRGEVYTVANGEFQLHGILKEGQLIKRERKRLQFDFKDTDFVFYILGATLFTQSFTKMQITDFFSLAKEMYMVELEIEIEEEGRNKILSFAENLFEMVFPEQVNRLVNDTEFYLDHLTEKELEIFVDKTKSHLHM